jgi:hypothetical protein
VFVAKLFEAVVVCELDAASDEFVANAFVLVTEAACCSPQDPVLLCEAVNVSPKLELCVLPVVNDPFRLAVCEVSFEVFELPFVTDPPGDALAVSLLVPDVVDAPVFEPFEDGFENEVVFPAVVVPVVPPIAV